MRARGCFVHAFMHVCNNACPASACSRRPVAWGRQNDNKKQAQAAAYYFSKALGLRPGSLYVNGKMVDLEGPTFNVFQVWFWLCVLVVWFRCVVSALLGVGGFCWRRRNVGTARHRSPVKSFGGLTNSKSDCRERALFVLFMFSGHPVKTP